MIWKCQFVCTFLYSCRIRYDFLFTTLWLVKNSPLRAQSKLMINSMIKMSLRVLRYLLSLRRFVVINTRWQKRRWKFVLCHEIGLSHERNMDICLEAFRLVLLGVLTLRKTTDVETVRTECSKTTLSLWFFIFFFSLICQICMTEGVVGGDSLFEKFDL